MNRASPVIAERLSITTMTVELPSFGRSWRVVAAAIALAVLPSLGCRLHSIPEERPSGTSGAVGYGRLTGRVVDAASGRSVMGAAVSLRLEEGDEAGASVEGAMTVDDGSFEIPRVPPGRYIVEVSARGYRTDKGSVRIRPSQSRSYVARLSAISACPTVAGRKSPGCP